LLLLLVEMRTRGRCPIRTPWVGRQRTEFKSRGLFSGLLLPLHRAQAGFRIRCGASGTAFCPAAGVMPSRSFSSGWTRRRIPVAPTPIASSSDSRHLSYSTRFAGSRFAGSRLNFVVWRFLAIFEHPSHCGSFALPRVSRTIEPQQYP